MINPLSRKPISYKGKRNIKQAGVQIEWTPELREEYRKCAESIEYFFENYVKIVSLDHGLIGFTPYQFQKDLIQLMEDERFIVAKLARQCGKSTVVLGYILHYILFNENKVVMILAHQHDASKKLMRQLKEMYGYLPTWLQQGVEEWNTQEIALENKTRVKAAAASPDAVRGESINMILMDEFAFVDPTIAEGMVASVIPTLSSGKTTKLFIISTPKGMNQFHKLWVEAENNRNGFKTFSRDYTCVPGRDEEWAKAELAKLGETKYNQEVLCQFLGSSFTLIRGDTLAKMVWVPPIEEIARLKIYEKVAEGHKYIVTVDPAGGNHGDYTVVSVFDVTSLPYKHVAVYRSNDVNTILIPATIHSIATHYNMAYVLIENNFGREIGTSLSFDHEYENILYNTNEKFVKQSLSLGYGKVTDIGVRMSVSVKKTGCACLKQLIESGKLVTQDFDAFSEMHIFVANGKGSYAADGENEHDDVVMSMVLFAWVTSQAVFTQMSDVNLKQDVTKQNFNEDVLPFGYIVNGINDQAVEGRGRFFRDADGLLWENVGYERDDIFGWPTKKE